MILSSVFRLPNGHEFICKGIALDDKCLKNGDRHCFRGLLQRTGDIRSCERNLY
ncbi:MAG: virulence RhuM family protein [Oligella ureolytica]|nr:virulence RhuM family protein [Oligella ureolytica]